MFRSGSDFESGEPPGVSMRTWLYLGAIAVGLGLMALEDRSITENATEVAAPQVQPAPANSEVSTKPAKATSKAADFGITRPVSADVSLRQPLFAR